MQQKLSGLIQAETKLPLAGITAVVKLLDDGATIPFIARYRKEMTGSMDEVGIAAIKKTYNDLQDLIKRKETILASIAEQGALTPALKSKIAGCWNKTTLEDLYLPYKKKQKTKATIARDNGLEPLAKIIMAQRTNSLFFDAKNYTNKKVPSADAALEGARHIISEWVSENPRARELIRNSYERYAEISSKVVKKKKEEAVKYEAYFDFTEALKKSPSHRLLAMFRGEKEGFLKVKLSIDHSFAKQKIKQQYIKQSNSDCSDQIELAIADALSRLILPSIENEIKKKAKQKADLEAIDVFSKNLKDLLLMAPLGEKSVLALDPGFRTGCKLVVLDSNGNLLHNTTIYPHPPQSKIENAQSTLLQLADKYKVRAIAIGNGTAGKETHKFVKDIKFPNPIDAYFVNESGASIYSASAVAREEFPEQDVTVRGAVSIGRRLMDPLAELVKIDAKSIGVGQYQHDVDQKLLKASLDNTIESCVNAVGININTASKHLLVYVSGLGPVLAQNIVDHRRETGPFKTRKDLQAVKRMGKKAFEQSVGFLRIRDGANPLDNTAVHPESYPVVKKIAKDLKTKPAALVGNQQLLETIQWTEYVTAKTGLPTLQDIHSELNKPGLDPRGSAQAMSFSNRINSISDLQIGMILPGIVNNVTKFGAFVDIGIKESGLVHISQIVDRYIKDPAEVLSVSQQVTVKVLDIDVTKKRISLSMKAV